MHEKICDLINRQYYGNALRSAVSLDGIRACQLQPLAGKAAVLVEYAPCDGSQVEQTAGGSRQNLGSAGVVVKLVEKIVSADDQVQIGVIAPYRAQVSLIKRQLRSTPLAAQLDKSIRVGTVHAFQGSEADVIIWDIVDDRACNVGRLYRGEAGDRLVNVAISRAKGKLIIVGDPEAFFEARGAEASGQFRWLFRTRFRIEEGNVVKASAI